MVVGERISERLRVVGLTQSALARELKIAQPTIAKLVAGTAQGSSHLHRIARALRTTPEYLTGEIDDPDVGALPAPTASSLADQLGLAMIPEVEISYGLGGTFLDTDKPATRMVPFRQDWLSRLTRGMPADVFLTQGEGDSMIPTILDGDDVLVNRADRTIRQQDRIWAVAYGDIGMIKRVRRLPDGSFELNSDNPSVRPVNALEEEMHVIGRVIWVGRRT